MELDAYSTADMPEKFPWDLIRKGSALGLRPSTAAASVLICYFMEYLESSPDAREGFNAYREKRTPAFAE